MIGRPHEHPAIGRDPEAQVVDDAEAVLLGVAGEDRGVVRRRRVPGAVHPLGPEAHRNEERGAGDPDLGHDRQLSTAPAHAEPEDRDDQGGVQPTPEHDAAEHAGEPPPVAGSRPGHAGDAQDGQRVRPQPVGRDAPHRRAEAEHGGRQQALAGSVGNSWGEVRRSSPGSSR